jgi:uncharacterized protein (TIGR03067 family)
MSIRIYCPGCRAGYTVGDQYEGKTARCKQCGASFMAIGVVEPGSAAIQAATPRASAAAPPRRQARAPQRQSPPPAGSARGITLGLMVAGSVVGLLFAVFGAVWISLSLRPSPAKTADSLQVYAKSQDRLPATDPADEKKPELPSASGAKESRSKVSKRVETEDDTPAIEPHGPKGQLSARALRDLKGATVFIKVAAGELSCSGSGFLVKVEDDTGYLVTNHHVVNPEAELLRPIRSGNRITVRTVKYKAKNAVITAVFHSGSKAERQLTAEIISTDESRDLAILSVKGMDDWPRPISLKQKLDLVETMPVYILGFPFGEALSLAKGNPAITINKGSVSSLRQNDFGQMKAVQIDGAINPGNSGGPVVDEDGRLVGVSVKTIIGAGIGLAIAPDELTRLFEGRVGAVGFHPISVDDTSAEFRIEMALIDPEQQIKSAALLYVVGTSRRAPFKQKEDGSFDPLPDAQRLELKIDGQRASGRLKVDVDDKHRVIMFQTSFVNGAGKVMYTQIGSRDIEGSRSPAASPPVAGGQAQRPPSESGSGAGNNMSPDEQKELKKFEGDWVAVESEDGGNYGWGGNPMFIENGVMTITIRGEMTFKYKIVKLDPTANPKTIDLRYIDGPNTGGNTQVGIYDWDGDNLKVCWAPIGETKRPKKFSTKPGVGQGFQYRLYERKAPPGDAQARGGQGGSGAARAGTDGMQKELKKLEGDWVAVRSEDGGNASEGGNPIFIEDGIMSIMIRGRVTFKCKIMKLDTSASPKTIDVKYVDGPGVGGEIQLGLYDWDGDNLKVCWAPVGDTKRPKKFSTKPGVGQGFQYRLYERKKD